MLSQISISLVSLIVGGLLGNYLALGRDARNHHRKCAEVPRKQISTAIRNECCWRALDGGVLEEIRFLLSDSDKTRLSQLESDFQITCQRLSEYDSAGIASPPNPEDLRRAKSLLGQIDTIIQAPAWWKIDLR